MQSRSLSHCKYGYKFTIIMFCNPIWRLQVWRKNNKRIFLHLAHMYYGWFKPTENKKARYKQMRFFLMKKVVVCWEMFVIMWRESLKFQRFGQFALVLESFTWRWHPWSRLGFIWLNVHLLMFMVGI